MRRAGFFASGAGQRARFYAGFYAAPAHTIMHRTCIMYTVHTPARTVARPPLTPTTPTPPGHGGGQGGGRLLGIDMEGQWAPGLPLGLGRTVHLMAWHGMAWRWVPL